MNRFFENLTQKEYEQLLKAPALVAVKAICRDNNITKAEKDDALQLSHLKTFSAAPQLLAYYKDVEVNFKNDFDAIIREYSPFDEQKRDALGKEINTVNAIIAKLNKNFSVIMQKSLLKYAEHVKKANRSVFVDILLPFELQGVND